jgi:predicted secreted protein
LLEEAMREFQQKAAVVTKGFGKTAYSIGEVSVNDEGRYGQPGPRMMTMASGDMMSKGMEIATASGTSDISVSINGRVCLKP